MVLRSACTIFVSDETAVSRYYSAPVPPEKFRGDAQRLHARIAQLRGAGRADSRARHHPDTEGIRSNRWLAALYDFGGFTSDRTFILTVCACVVAVILFKSLANLALYKIERNFIYDLYRELSRRLYVDYRNRGLGFIKSSNSAVLARNVNVVCLTFVTGVLMPVAAMASEAVLFALLFGSLAIYNPLVALLTLAIFVPSVALYYYLVRQRLNRYGEEENRAQRRKSRTVIETFRGYADLEIAGAIPRC